MSIGIGTHPIKHKKRLKEVNGMISKDNIIFAPTMVLYSDENGIATVDLSRLL
ncbi:hypothetical protein [Shewanella sp.]|uniref:hypothetical protein n=1 Tax=Shewanella sp. TaxID=50422 RepID=UPI0025D07BDB|nr:hypothetical protein [Shewanella sp.]